jgi:hypothetical protein
MKRILNISFVVFLLFTFVSCQRENDQAKIGGKPEISYIRALSIENPDNLVEGEFLGARLAIIGKGLAGVTKIMFNDVQAALNPAYVTETSIIVSIPQTIPGVKTDIVTLYTCDDSLAYPFEVRVPAPTVTSMDCEWLNEGDVAYINGQYFVNDGANPLTVTFTGGVQAAISEMSLSRIAVEVPAGAQTGPVTITSVYGATVSSFWYRDDRNIILDFNNGKYPDYDYFFGWHGAGGVSDENGINGNYLKIGDGSTEASKESWSDGKFGYEVWTYSPTDPDFFDVSKIDNFSLKFEVRVPNTWSACALRILFTGKDDVMLNWQNGNGLTYDPSWGAANAYMGDDASYPCMLWNPWAETGSYQNDNWITVTIPMKECKYNKDGEAASTKGAGHYSGISLFLNGGGIDGVACTPIIHVDNVRIVPSK